VNRREAIPGLGRGGLALLQGMPVRLPKWAGILLGVASVLGLAAACSAVHSGRTARPPALARAAPAAVSAAAAPTRSPPPAPLGAKAAPPAAAASDEDPLAALDDVPALRRSAEAWIDERTKAAGDERVTSTLVHRFAEATNAAAVMLVLSQGDPAETSRRVFGLVSTGAGGSQTLEIPSEPCGDLEPSLVDLHGDGARFAVFTEIGGGYHCALTGSSVAYELVGERWLVALAPAEAGGSTLINADLIPDFATSLAIFDLGECNYAACGDYFFRVDILGYESWDGTKFASAGRYKNFYEGQYQELADVGKSLGPAENCETERLRDGVRAFAYVILSGRSRREALALARSFFRGVRPELCHDNGAIRSLPEIEQLLLRAQPGLEAAR